MRGTSTPVTPGGMSCGVRPGSGTVNILPFSVSAVRSVAVWALTTLPCHLGLKAKAEGQPPPPSDMLLITSLAYLANIIQQKANKTRNREKIRLTGNRLILPVGPLNPPPELRKSLWHDIKNEFAGELTSPRLHFIVGDAHAVRGSRLTGVRG